MTYITRATAITTVREATKRSWSACKERVYKLDTKKDGERKKVHTDDVNALIAELNAPPKKMYVRPISAKQIAQIS